MTCDLVSRMTPSIAQSHICKPDVLSPGLRVSQKLGARLVHTQALPHAADRNPCQEPSTSGAQRFNRLAYPLSCEDVVLAYTPTQGSMRDSLAGSGFGWAVSRSIPLLLLLTRIKYSVKEVYMLKCAMPPYRKRHHNYEPHVVRSLLSAYGHGSLQGVTITSIKMTNFDASIQKSDSML